MVSPLQVAAAGVRSGPTNDWPLDEPSGTTIAAIVGTNGTWSTGPSLHAQPALLPGASLCAGLDFGSRGDLSADTTAADCTWMWVSRDDRNDLARKQWAGHFTGGGIRGQFGPGGEFFGIGGRWTGAFYDGDWDAVVDSSTSIDGDPHLWGLVRDSTAGEYRLVQDGVVVGTYTGSVSAPSGGDDTIYLGTYWDGASGSFVGGMSDYMVWNGEALDQDDWDVLWEAAIGGAPPPEGQSSTVSWG